MLPEIPLVRTSSFAVDGHRHASAYLCYRHRDAVLSGVNMNRCGAALLAAMAMGSGAMAATPLTWTASTTGSATAGSIISVTATEGGDGHLLGGATNNNAVSVAAAVAVSQFDTRNGILLGASAHVNTAMQITSSLLVSAMYPDVTMNSMFTGNVSAPGVAFATDGHTLSGECKYDSCIDRSKNAVSSSALILNASSIVPNANLSDYAGNANVFFDRRANGMVQLISEYPLDSATVESFMTFDARDSGGTYSIVYSYLDFANPSFDGAANQNALTLDFGNLVRGTGPVTLNFSLFNIGNANSAGLDLIGIERGFNDARFTTTLDRFAELAGGGSRSYSMTFDPSTLGAASEIFALNLSDRVVGGIGGNDYMLSINALANVVNGTAAVPEPQSWAMMLIGFVLTGTAIRRRETIRRETRRRLPA